MHHYYFHVRLYVPSKGSNLKFAIGSVLSTFLECSAMDARNVSSHPILTNNAIIHHPQNYA